MATNIVNREIQLNLNFTWDSENININPSGWVLLESKINGQDCSNNDINTITLNFKEGSDTETTTWSIPSFFKNVFNYTVRTDPSETGEGLYKFSLSYEPEKFKGVYSKYKELYSEDAYNNIEVGQDIKYKDGTEVPLFNDYTLKQLREKQFEYKPYFDNVYSDDKYSFKYTDNKATGSIELILNRDNITDQILVQLLNTSIIKNINNIFIPLKQQTINDKIYTCYSGLVWEYNIAPIMPYGVLEPLAVKGSIDLMEIGIYKQEINQFKYYNSGYQSTLSLGMTSYNSQGHTLDTIMLEFYDLYGKVCTYTLPKMISYNGTFQVTIPLDGSLHSGMEANPNYPNSFSETELAIPLPEGVTRLANKDCNRYINKVIDALNIGDTHLYAYHDLSQPEGLHPNYLYWVNIKWKEEESDTYQDSGYGYWYWTNNKFNEYYFNSDYNNYDDIPFDLTLQVSAGIEGTTPNINQTEQDTETEFLTIYTEENQNNPFKVKIYPDLENNYNTLACDSNDINSLIENISFGINSNLFEWNRDLAVLNVPDETKDGDSHVYWNIKYHSNNPVTVTDQNISYYPTFGITTEETSFLGKKLNCSDIANTSLNNVIFDLTEEIQRVFLHTKSFQNKTITYHPVITKPLLTKHVSSGMYTYEAAKPITYIFVRDNYEGIQILENDLLSVKWHYDQVSYQAKSGGGSSSAAYFSPKNTTQQFSYSWFIRNGGTKIPISCLGLDDNQIGVVTFDGVVGDSQTHHLYGWDCDYTKTATNWEVDNDQTTRNPWIQRDNDEQGYNQANQTKILYFYKYKSDYYFFDYNSNFPSALKHVLYCIDETDSQTGKKEHVLSEIKQNTGFIQNLQDLIIQIKGQNNPKIYIGHLNVNLWKNIPNCNREASCIKFNFNNIAQTVLNLRIKIPYPQKYIEDITYYKDPDSGEILTYTDKKVYYKENDSRIFLENATFDENGLKLFDLLDWDRHEWTQGVTTLKYKVESHDRKNKKRLRDYTNNMMAGTFTIPYKKYKE